MSSFEFPDLLYPEPLHCSDQPHEILLDQWSVTSMVRLDALSTPHFPQCILIQLGFKRGQEFRHAKNRSHPSNIRPSSDGPTIHLFK